MDASPFSHALPAFLILIQFSTNYINSASAATTFPPKTNTNYIKTSCNLTTYPKLCYNSLSIYAAKIKTDPKTLAGTALNVSLVATKSTLTKMKKMSKVHGLKPREAAAMVDCVEEVGDSVAELQKSIGELYNYTGRGIDFGMQMNDIETWVSAALTDEDTCMEGFGGNYDMNIGSVKAFVRREILKIARLTSNTLALINMYASTKVASPYKP